MKAGFVSLGCAKNLVDTEVMLGIMQERGIELTANPADADILIVNTCAFILSAKEESITTILHLADFKKGRCRALIVAGCLGQLYKRELLDEMPEVDAVIGTGAWNRIMEAIAETLSGRRVILLGEREIIYDAKTPRLRTTPPYTAYVKIAEGCNNRCSFCSIPLIRGRQISRPIEDIKLEVERLASQGVKEINLIAQDTTAYGTDLYGKPQLVELLRELVKVDVPWIRILYAYPRRFTDELIDLIAAEPKICNYVDLPLQHASNKILKLMNRPDTRESIEALLKKIRAKIPGVVIRSTFIVGFPGETDDDFQELKNFLQEQRLDKVGIFTYSREEGTAAYDFPEQISEEVMQERYHDLMSMQSLISQELNEALEGQELEVLIEGRDEEVNQVVAGRSYRDAPEVDGLVYIENDGRSKEGDLVRVKVLAGFVYDIAAERIG
ncbi:MAG: 30S ribosomal protein S12 methylthiotransferase RimO [Selenomonadaceae bacterium]|nr:30S ribosomal protein S12 methylthiotransferase RimO [Selenomonadaceae bacterium]MBR0102601.1 30S ribosomal protein S12 methylthiotransferase RimO [Selenomonadaceae bacterium]